MIIKVACSGDSCNNINGLKLKILKVYLTAGNRFLPAHTFYFNPTLKPR
jgi:hypothetical protein